MIEAHKFIERKDWEKGSVMPLGVSLTGLKVGIAGLGRIGKAIAARLEAFKCDIAYFAHSKKRRFLINSYVIKRYDFMVRRINYRYVRPPKKPSTASTKKYFKNRT